MVAGLDARRLRRLPAEHPDGVPASGWRTWPRPWTHRTPERSDADALLVVELQSAPHTRMALHMEAYVALLLPFANPSRVSAKTATEGGLGALQTALKRCSRRTRPAQTRA